MGVKCLAQEHNTVPRPGLEPGSFDPESSALTIRPPRLPDEVLRAKQNVLVIISVRYMGVLFHTFYYY